MRPPGTPYQLQKRREHAIRMLTVGNKTLSAVARAVSAAPSSVLRWQQAYQRHGRKGLRAKPIPGRPPHLSRVQKEQLVPVLLDGPLAAGFKTDLWTLKRIAKIIKRLFGITYHPSHVWKILHELGWSCQKPEWRATQRDEKAIAHWKRYIWPKIKKKADRLGAYLIFLDESGFLLIPNVKRTWAPKGKTPTVHYRLDHHKLSAINALAVSPKRKHIALYIRFQSQSFQGPGVLRFLKYLLQHLRGRGVLLWDRGRIHRDGEVQTFIENHPRLQVEEFPGYAPELNPAEYVWMQADSALANSVPEEIAELKPMLVATKRRLRRSQNLLWACIYASDLPWKD
jgi:transposase